MTGCGGENPEPAPHHHDQPGHPGGTGEHGHSHGVTASSASRYITIALALIAVSWSSRSSWPSSAIPWRCWPMPVTSAPEGYAPGEITTVITRQPDVASVHDVHVWLITSGFPALSAHVLVSPPADCHHVRRKLEQLLCERFALDHTTLQVDHALDDLLTAGSGTR